MYATVFLVFDRKRVLRMTTKYLPDMKSGEYMIRVRIQVPDTYFDRSIPTAEIVVPEMAITDAPIEVDVQMPEGSEEPNERP